MAGAAAALILGLQLVAAATADVAAGIQPVVAGEPGEPAVTASLSPTIGATDDTRAVFRGTYSPRAFWRHPYGLGVLRPALLHSLQLAYSPLPRGRTQLALGSNATMGELDYTAVSTVFGTGQSVAPTDPFIDVLRAAIEASLRHAVDQRLATQATLSASYQETSFGTGSAAFSSYDVRLNPSLSYRLTRRDTLSAVVTSHAAFFDTADQLSLELSAGYARVLSRRLQFTASGGVGRIQEFAHDDQAPDQDVDGRVQLTRPLHYGLGSFALQRSRERGSDTVSVGLGARVDPFLQQMRPLASASVNSVEQLSRRVSLGASATAFTVVFAEPIALAPGDADTFVVSETGANVSSYVSVQFEDLMLSSGFRLGFRAPHLEQTFEMRETEAVLFVRLSWARQAL